MSWKRSRSPRHNDFFTDYRDIKFKLTAHRLDSENRNTVLCNKNYRNTAPKITQYRNTANPYAPLLIIMLRFSEWFAPCKLKATVKRTTKTLRILPPTFKPVSQQIRLLQVAFILDSDWKNLRGSRAIRGSYVTYCKTSLPWASKTRATCTDFLQKVEQLSTFGSNFPQPATSWFVARQLWFVGGKTRKLAIECFHMTSRRPYWCHKPILWTLNSFLMQTISFVPINLHRCWPREWKSSIQFVLQQNKSLVFPARCTVP